MNASDSPIEKRKDWTESRRSGDPPSLLPGRSHGTLSEHANGGGGHHENGVAERLDGEPEPGGVAYRLWRDMEDLQWQELYLPFVRGLAHATLPRETFQAFIAQDAHYLGTASTIYSQMLAKAPQGGQKAIAAIQDMLEDTQEEVSLHVGFAESWDVDLEEWTEPSDAHKRFAEFLTSIVEGPKSLAHAIAAVWSSARIFSFIGKQVAATVSTKGHPYKEWITTYGSPEYEELPCKQEELLNAVGPAQPYDELLAIARKVADLDMMLLTDLPGCEALPPVRVMVISFAAAWAGDDLPLSLEQPLAWVAERTAGSNGAVKHGLPLQCMQDKQALLVEANETNRQELISTYTAEGRSSNYRPEAVAEFKRELDAIDGQMMDAASDWGVMAGIPMHVFSRTGSKHELKRGAAEAMGRAAATGVPIHMIARVCTHYAVSTVLTAAQLPLMDDTIAAVFPRCKAVRALPPRSSDKDAGSGSIAVHAPLLEWDDSSRCAGRLLWQHEGFSHNASPSWEADMAGRGFSSGSRDTGLSVYVGAAPADLQPMLSADIGILVGADPEVRQLLPAFGIDLRLLTTVPIHARDLPDGVLYQARSWYEVEAFLWGPRKSYALTKTQSSASLNGKARFLRQIRPSDIQICLREDGTEWLLGSGSFGEVYKGLRFRVQEVAVKRPAPALRTAEALARLQEEVQIMEHVSFDRNIVQYYGVCMEGENAAMLVLEYMAGGDLRHALTTREESAFTWAGPGKSIALDISRGLHFLHTSGVVHRDLKSNNIMLTGEGVAKIGDVGLAWVRSQGDPDYEFTQAVSSHAAPEAVLGDECTEKVDIYSIGVILWEIVTREQAVRGRLRDVIVPNECPQAVSDLIDDCLQQNPQRRPSAEELFTRLQAS